MEVNGSHARSLVALATLSGALFVAFVYGYPKVFPAFEASSPENYEAAMSEAVAAGDVARARTIGRYAVSELPYDPMAYTAYGRLLLEHGDPAAGLEQLGRAIALGVDLPRAPYDESRRPYYFAPARLARGAHYYHTGRTHEAVVDFELARAYADPAGSDFAPYREALYGAYARLGFWSRALEYGAPSDDERAGRSAPEALRLARAAEGAGDWDEAVRWADNLRRRGEHAAEADYFEGRAALARGRYAECEASLERAARAGVPHAAFFLGTALERAGATIPALEAYLRVPSDDLYRCFALARAAALRSALPEDGEAAASWPTSDEIQAQLDDAIDRLKALPHPKVHDEYRRFTPLAFATSPAYPAFGGRFPLLILWKDEGPPKLGSDHLSYSASEGYDTLTLERGSDVIVQLQWVANAVYWEGVEVLPPGRGTVPGWIDTAREWFRLRSDSAAQVERDASGNNFLSLDKRTWYYSVPAPVEYDVGYLLAGRVRSTPGKGGLGWQAINEKERVVFDGDAAGASADDWAWQAAYARAQLTWDAVRVELKVAPRAGRVSFDDVMLVPVREPERVH